MDVPNRMGQYIVRDRIASGGACEVYEAEQAILHRSVVLKILSPQKAEDPAQVQSLRKEARIASSLDHPNTIIVHECGNVDGFHYICMEKVDGCSVKELLLRHGLLSPPAALEIVAQASKGLASAWSKGLLHCDVKPANLLLSRDGRVRVSDFGLACSVEQNPNPMKLAGTPPYISPERAGAEGKLDFNSDIYSLGITLYQLLSGQMPISGKNDIEILKNQIREEPEPLDTEPVLQSLLNRMLAKAPGERFKTIDEFLAEIESTRQELSDNPHVLIELMAAEPPPAPAVTEVGNSTSVARRRKRLRISLKNAVSVCFLLFSAWFVPARFMSAKYNNEAVQLVEQGMPWEALEKLKQAVRWNPFDKRIRDEALVLVLELTSAPVNDLERALISVGNLEWATKLGGEDPVIHLQLARLHKYLGNRQKALAAVRAYVKIVPDEPTGRALLDSLEF
ncbi:MAG: serine/threonine-protein kinase [Planctomycetota bacterium]|nr:serine/threonine-protein kinase [Planctomycetota bacterium]MDA1141180.1 serine/threonine-protein kinase [Planctomycetota bacterium]